MTGDPAALLSFRKELRACTRCELHESCTSPVPWYGDVNPDIAILGEAPGRSEDREGRPFIGDAGQLLRYLLRESDFDPESITWLNAVQCYPRLIHNPQRSHIDACRIWMRGQLALIQPKYLITVGVTAFQSIRHPLTWPKLAAIHGKPLFWEMAPFSPKPILMSTYHPSAALRGGKKYKRMILEDLRAFRKWLRDGEVWPEDGCYICGDEVYRYDGWGIAVCTRHAARQVGLFPDDELAELEISRK